MGWGIYGLIVAWILSQYANILVLSIGVNRKVNRSHWKIQTVVDTLTEYRDFPLTNSLHAFTDIFVTQFLLFYLISEHFGNTALGVFAMMNKYVRAPIVLVTSSVSQLFYAEASKNLHEGTSLLPIAKKTLKTSMMFSIPFALVLFFFGIPIFEWYLGHEWKDAGVYARILLPTLILMFATSPLSGLPLLLKKQKTAYALSVLGYSLSIGILVLGIALNWKFENALWGYSLAFSGYYLILLSWYFSLIKKTTKHARTH
jgi:O-antigen/teichoic acid export membrane protein